MKWEKHNKWAEKLYIPKEISNYVNNIIDIRKLLPQDYRDFVRKESERIANNPKKYVSRSIEEQVFKHDSARKAKSKSTREVVANIQLNFLRQKGENYVKAWYLHHTLDYLEDTGEWRKDTGETIENCINKHQKNKPQTYSEEIVDFLKKHVQELREDLGL